MDASFHIRPFAFDRVFAVVPGAMSEHGADDLRLQVAALEAEMDRLRLEQETALVLARAEAFEAGLKQAREERDTALLAATDALHGAIEALDRQMDTLARDLTRDATEVALAAADVLAGRALELDAGAAIDEAIGRVLKQVPRGQELYVRVGPPMVEAVEALVAARQGRDRRRLNLHVVPDEALALGDALIAWDEGGLALDATARAAAVRAELETLLSA